LVTGYLEGTDGRKMSKSWGNAVWLEDNPNEIYGKIMSLKDDLILQYFTYATNYTVTKIGEIEDKINKGENPIVFKKELAFEIVSDIYDKNKANEAQKYFEKTFQKRIPTFSEIAERKEDLASTIAPFTTRKSISDAKRYLIQKSVSVNGKMITDPTYKVVSGDKIKIGEKTFVQIK